MAEQNRGGWRTQNAAPGPYVPRSARGVNSFRLAPPGLEPPLGVPQPVTLAVGLQDVHPVRQAVQDRPGQPFAPAHLRPCLERQVRRHHQTRPRSRPGQFRAEPPRVTTLSSRAVPPEQPFPAWLARVDYAL